MTEKELKQIYYLNRELKMWQQKKEEYLCKSLITGQQLSGMPKAAGCGDKTGDYATDIAEIDRVIEGRLVEIQRQRKAIIEFIEQIDDSLMRQIVFYRNVSCMSWQQVANHIGGNNKANSMRMAYNRFLAKK